MSRKSNSYVYSLLLILLIVSLLSFWIKENFKEHFEVVAPKVCVNDVCFSKNSLDALLALENIQEGQAIKCKDDGNSTARVYRYEQGWRKHYPNAQVADSWDKSWRKSVKTVNCAMIPEGRVMATAPVKK